MKRTQKPPAPVVEGTPEELLERMKIFTRRIIAVPKARVVTPKRGRRKHR
jgi:hypothetical protein